jgi:hypothetical protein
VDSSGLEWGPMASSCEHGDELSDFGATELVSSWLFPQVSVYQNIIHPARFSLDILAQSYRRS